MSQVDAGPDERKGKRRSSAFLFVRDAAVAFILVVCILGAMYAYTGLWPPLVVIESDSMMHGDDNLSHIGTIDTGDLVLVKDVKDEGDIETYLDGYLSGHKTYGDYGDVIVYKRGGLDTYTPIIHRALVYLEANPDGMSYRVDALQSVPIQKWITVDPTDTWDHLTSTLVIFNVGWESVTVYINIEAMAEPLRSGYITKGDHNPNIDQAYSGGSGAIPVQLEWVVGKARGEIPWFGLLKLWSTDSLGSTAPSNSVRNLWIAIALIVISPILIDIALTYRQKRRIAADRADNASTVEEEKKPEAQDSDGRAEKPPDT